MPLRGAISPPRGWRHGCSPRTLTAGPGSLDFPVAAWRLGGWFAARLPDDQTTNKKSMEFEHPDELLACGNV
jgi:hypothetical protein